MKKTILLGLLTLMVLTGLRAQTCDTVRTFPWMEDIAAHSGCWVHLGDTSSVWAPNEEYAYSYTGSSIFGLVSGNNVPADGCVLASPAIALPNDTVDLSLSFRARRIGTGVTLRVLVGTGERDSLSAYDTVRILTSVGYQTVTVDLAAYAGQTVYIAFSLVKPNVNYNLTFFGIGDIAIESTRMPKGTLTASPLAARLNDTVVFTYSAQRGSDSLLTYTWHSSLANSTIVTAAPSLAMAYPTPGIDTVSLVVANAFGSITLKAMAGTYDCATVSTFPFVEDFAAVQHEAAYDACWRISGWSHVPENYYYNGKNDIMRTSATGSYMITPPVVIPSDGAEHMALWVNFQGGVTVAVSTQGDTSAALFTDTLFASTNNYYTSTQKVLPLTQYAGDVIYVGIFSNRNGTTTFDSVAIDYDTLPVLTAITAPAKTRTDSTIVCTVALDHGATEGLSIAWHSSLMDTTIVADTLRLTYTEGGVDTITAIATNDFGSGSATTIVKVADCNPAITLPWKETFADGLVCWHKPEGSKWIDAIPYNNSSYEYLRHLYLNVRNDTAGSWIMSKEIQLPADTSLLPYLFWKVASSNNSYRHSYSMLITDSADFTDTANYTLLYLDTATHVNFRNYDTRGVSLAAYAGKNVHIAIHNSGNHLAPSSIGLYIDDVEIRSTAMPKVVVAADRGTYYYGDTATFTASLTEGSTAGLTYTWHSSLLDSTIVAGETLRLNYGLVNGLDTVTVIATNIFGSDTAWTGVYSEIVTQTTIRDFTADGMTFFLGSDHAEVGDTMHYMIVRNHCVTTGLTYSLHSSLLDTTVTVAYTGDICRIALIYDVAGNDSLTAVLANAYSADTSTLRLAVNDCPAVGVPFFETFDSIVTEYNNLLPCWPGWWVLTTSHMVGNSGIGRHGYLISPAIDLPADTLGLQLSWYTAFNTMATVPVRILVSPTGGKRVEDFSDMLFDRHVVDFAYDSVSLDAYRGQRIRLAFVNVGYSNMIDNIRVDYDRSAPQLTIAGSASPNVLDDNVYVASLASGSPHGMTYSWRSSMADGGLASLSTRGDTAVVRYLASGTDTLHCIATNNYGADTAVRVVNVTGCGYTQLPYSEDFNNTLQSTLPDCWSKAWQSPATGSGADVYPPNSEYFSPDASQVLVMRASYSSYYDYYDSVSYVMLPVFEDPVNSLTLSFWYTYEDTARGQLSVGYMDGGSFVAMADMPTVDHAGRRDTISFASASASATRLAFRWKHNLSPWYSCSIDNVEVTSNVSANDNITLVATDSTQTEVRLDGPTAAYVFDTVGFEAIVDSGNVAGLVYTWHSTLTGTSSSGSRFAITYTTTGIDTVSLTATNGVDTGTLYRRVTVTAPLQVALAGASHAISSEPIDFEAMVTVGSSNGVTYSWRSAMADAGNALMAMTGNRLSIEYLAGGTDTVTVTATNGFHSHSASAIVSVLYCSFASFPVTEGFESGGDGSYGDDCWTTVNQSEEYGWRRRGESRYSGSWAMEAVYPTHGNPTSDWLISPTIEVPDSGSLTMRFRLLYYDYSVYPAIDHLHLLVSTDGRSDTTLFTTELTAQDCGMDGNFWRQYRVSLDGYQGQTINIAMRNDATVHYDNSTVNSGKRVVVDAIDFFFDQTPVVTLSADDTYYTCDTAVATVSYNRHDSLLYDIRWHSTMADRGQATLLPQGDTLRIVYLAGGRDTVSVAVENVFGTDSASRTAQVYSCSVVSSFPYVSTPVTDDDEWHCWKTWTGSRYGGWGRAYDYYNHGWGSYLCIMSKVSSNQTIDEWLVSPLIALPADADTITLRWNGFCEETTFNLELSTTGRDSAAQFSTTLFTETHGSLYTPQAQNHWSTYSVDLSAWRGQTVSLAWHNVGPAQYPYGYVAMDTMWIECSYSAPVPPPPTPDTVWHTVTVTANVDGVCQPYGSGVYADSSTVEIGYRVIDTMAEGSHWQFLGWNDDGEDNPRNIFVTSDTVIVALFEWVEDSVGIAEVGSGKTKVEIYPNPATTDVIIRVGEPSTLTVIDLTGRVVIPPTSITSDLLLSTSNLPAGTYFVRVTSVRGSVAKKLVLR